jgi:hypothetical protein
VINAVDEHVAKALASLADVSARQLQLDATAEALGRRRDCLGGFSSVFRDVAYSPSSAAGTNSPSGSWRPSRPSGDMCAMHWPSGIRNSGPPFRKHFCTEAITRYGERLPTIFLDRNVVYHSTVECPDYPQPPEAWWAWPHYQKGI